MGGTINGSMHGEILKKIVTRGNLNFKEHAVQQSRVTMGSFSLGFPEMNLNDTTNINTELSLLLQYLLEDYSFHQCNESQ